MIPFLITVLTLNVKTSNWAFSMYLCGTYNVAKSVVETIRLQIVIPIEIQYVRLDWLIE